MTEAAWAEMSGAGSRGRGDLKALVYKGMPPNVTCCDATLRIQPNGEWAVFFMTGGNIEPEPANFVGLCRSSDGGRVWGPLETVCKYDDRGRTWEQTVLVRSRTWAENNVVELRDGRESFSARLPEPNPGWRPR